MNRTYALRSLAVYTGLFILSAASAQVLAMDFLENRECIIGRPSRAPVHTQCVISGGMSNRTIDISIKTADGKTFALDEPNDRFEGHKYSLEERPARKSDDDSQCYRRLDAHLEICTGHRTEDLAEASTAPRMGFIFGSREVHHASDPNLSIRLGEQISVSALEERFARYEVRYTKGDDCLTCATISGADGQFEVSFAQDGRTVVDIRSYDSFSRDAKGNTVGASLVKAVGSTSAQCDAGMDTTCASLSLKGLSYVLKDDDRCAITVKEQGPTDIPACARIAGFQILEEKAGADPLKKLFKDAQQWDVSVRTPNGLTVKGMFGAIFGHLKQVGYDCAVDAQSPPQFVVRCTYTNEQQLGQTDRWFYAFNTISEKEVELTKAASELLGKEISGPGIEELADLLVRSDAGGTPASDPIVQPRERHSPEFAAYPATPYLGPRAPVILSKEAYVYRTRITEASRLAPNFAGRFVLVQWGCGTSCVVGAVIDVSTGRVTMLPFTICCSKSNDPQFKAISFRVDSRLIAFSGMRNEEEPNGTHFYIFNGHTFDFIQTVTETQNAR